MGVSVRVTKNVRVYLPFWVAIPAWLLIGAAYLVVFVIYGMVWLLVQGGAGIGRLSAGRQIRRAAPAVRGAKDVATARAASASAVGRWTGPVRNVKRTRRNLEFQIVDPDRQMVGPFVMGARVSRRGGRFSVPWSIGGDLPPLRDGDVVELHVPESGRNPQLSIVQRADGVTPGQQQAALPEPTAAPDFHHSAYAWPPLRVDGPAGRPWQRDWAVWSLILFLPVFIAGAVIVPLGSVGLAFGLIIMFGTMVAAMAAVVALLARWLRRWRAGRTHAA